MSVECAVVNRIQGIVDGYERPFDRFNELLRLQMRGIYIVPEANERLKVGMINARVRGRKEE